MIVVHVNDSEVTAMLKSMARRVGDMSPAMSDIGMELAYGSRQTVVRGTDWEVLSALFAAAVAALPAGALLARSMDKKLTPWLEETTGVIGQGDAAAAAFAFDLGGPIVPGSLEITDGVETFTDDGFGVLTGSSAGYGRVNYSNGQAEVIFFAPPANEADIVAQWTPRVAGVLDVGLDTGQSTSGLYVAHGSVRKDVLKVADGGGGYEAPAAAMLATLQTIGIYPE